MNVRHHMTRMFRATAVAACLAALAAPATSAAVGGEHFITDTLARGGGSATPNDKSDVVSRYIVRHGLSDGHFITDTLAPGGGSATPNDKSDVVSRYIVRHGLSDGRFTSDNASIGASARQGYRFITDTLAPGGGLVTVSPGGNRVSWRDVGVGFVAAVVLLGLARTTRFLLQRRTYLAA